MKLTNKATRYRQCLVSGCGTLFTTQQAQSKHWWREHYIKNGKKNKRGVSWDYVMVKTIIEKRISAVGGVAALLAFETKENEG